MTCNEFKSLALSFPHITEAPHFERTAFKIIDRRIFATLDEESETVNLKLTPVDQSIYCQTDQKSIFPVNNKWVYKVGLLLKFDLSIIL